MQCTIIVPDKTVTINGKHVQLDQADFAGLGAVHAIQFNEETGGEIEWKELNGVKPPNTSIQDLQVVQRVMDAAQAKIDVEEFEEIG